MAEGKKPVRHRKRPKLQADRSNATFARKELAAYEFLCHKQEAKEWMVIIIILFYDLINCDDESDAGRSAW